MKQHRLLPLLLSIFFYQGLLAQCPVGQHELKLEIDPDQYWSEVRWTITSLSTGAVYVTGNLFEDSLACFYILYSR